MKTLPREPWRGGQICGYQTNVGGWSEGPAAYCGELKKPGSPVCDKHDAELREDNYGSLPKFAPGNALGLTLAHDSFHYTVHRDGKLIAFCLAAAPLERKYGFSLSWEPMDTPEDPHGETPVPATEEEVKAWQNSEA